MPTARSIVSGILLVVSLPACSMDPAGPNAIHPSIGDAGELQPAGSFSLVVDVTALSTDLGRMVQGPVGTIVGFATDQPLLIDLDPGFYRLDLPAGGGRSVPFEVLSDGTIDYDVALDPFVAGRGTDTITVTGYAIHLDPRALSTPLGRIPTVLDFTTDVVTSARVVPGLYGLDLPAGGGRTVPFEVLSDGAIDYDVALDPFVAGRGTDTITVEGYEIGVDATASEFDQIRVRSVTDFFPRTVPKAIRIIPGLYCVDPGCLEFTLTGSGRVGYARSLDDAFFGRGTYILGIGLPGPDQQVDVIEAFIEDLIEGGALDGGQGTGLVSRLDAVSRALEAEGEIQSIVAQLRALSLQIQVMLSNGKIQKEDAEVLLDGIEELMISLES